MASNIMDKQVVEIEFGDIGVGYPLSYPIKEMDWFAAKVSGKYLRFLKK